MVVLVIVFKNSSFLVRVRVRTKKKNVHKTNCSDCASLYIGETDENIKKETYNKLQCKKIGDKSFNLLIMLTKKSKVRF